VQMNYKKSSFRPSDGTRTGRVWEIADEITKATGTKASRKAVIDAYHREGGMRSTASTQYHHWQQQYANTSVEFENSPGKPYDVEAQEIEMGSDGRLIIPVAMRKAMLIAPGNRVTAWVDDGELKIVGAQVGLLKMQAKFRKYIPKDVCLVDELIKERREEAAKEERELAGS